MQLDRGRAGIARVLDDRLVRPVYQPVVDLDRDVVVGYEALARGPRGDLHTPGRLFEAARAAGRLVELDWLCREEAVDGARDAGLRHPLSLFVNAEPETLLASLEDAPRWRRFADVRCYAEVTERHLVADPAALLRAVDQVREQDWGVAVDDVGVHPASLALLPLLRPDVVKLDLRMLQQAPAGPRDREVAQVLHAVLQYAGETGAAVVAEGIETEAHLDLARAYGVQYGQGYLLGRPADLPDPLRTPPGAVPLLARQLDRAVSPGPFAVVSNGASTRRVTRAGVAEIARQLLAQALDQEPAPVVLACVGDPVLQTGAHAELLQALAGGPLTAALLGRPGPLAAGPLRTCLLEPDDPGREDFDVVVLGPHYAGALVSRPALPDDGQTRDAVLTFDRTVVAAAGNSLVQRLGRR